MPTISDLRLQAATIKNATQVGENTATRVGTTFETIADLLEGASVGQGVPSVDLSQLNNLRTPADQTTANPTIYNVTTLHNLSSTTIKVGTLFIFSDGGRAVVTQILLSNYQVDGGGNISSPNTSQITMYYRMFNIVQETWSAWTLYAGGGGGGTIDPYPVSGSDNAVASNGVFERLQQAAPEININDIDDLDDYVDMRTGESSVYTLKYMHTQSSTWLRVGVVMCFANQAQNTLTQIVFSNCVVDGGGNLVPNSTTNVMNIYYRFKQFSGNPPEGMTIGVWSAWTKFEGGGGGEIDAYTKAETNALLAQKQDTISDLSTIRSGASAGATAVQPATMNTALNGKQDTISDLATIRSGAAEGATAYQKPFNGIPSTDLASAVQSALSAANAAAPQATTYTKAEINALLNPINATIEWVTALPGTGTANTLYCVQGSNSFSCYGWDGTQFVKMAEYQWIVTDTIADGNNNAASSNGVFGFVPIHNGRTIDGIDLALADDNGYAIVEFSDGNVQTKNFNSAQTPTEANPSGGNADFAISDANEKCIVVFEGGHIRTKNFDSSNIEQNATLQAVLNKYNGKKVSILGDSISTFGSPDSRNLNGTYCYSYYPTETCRYSELGNVTEGGTTYTSIAFNVLNTWWMQVINKIGATLGINESWRGTRVSGTAANAFNNQTRINHLGENGTPNLILVFGGTNDAGYSVSVGTFNGGNYSDYDTPEKIAALPVTTFADAYKAMLIRLMYTYPLAEIVCILPTFTTSYYTISALDNYVEVIKEACDFFGIKWIDVRVSDINIFNKATYLVDGTHPNAQGMTLLANKIYKHLIFD